MALVVSNIQKASVGTQLKVTGRIAFDSSYVTGGEPLSAAVIGLVRFDNIVLQPEQGYFFSTIYPTYQPTSVNLQVWEGGLSAFTPAGTNAAVSAGTPAGTNGASSVTGTADAQIFSGTFSPLYMTAPVFSGTGLTAAGQDITTTDNQTMTLNQCAGMWLVPATGSTPAVLILSNTAVSGAPAVFTVQGVAMTDAGPYKVLATLPTGTNGSSSVSGTAGAQTFTGSALGTHTHTFTGTPVGASVATQVPNATNLSALSAVEFVAFGW